MSPPAPPLLTVRDSEIMRLLRGGASPARVIAIGTYRQAWSRADVARVVTERLTPQKRARARLVPWVPPEPADDHRDVRLTRRQAQVLTYLCEGLGNAAIADAMGISLDTVKTHVRGLIAAIGAENRSHAAVLALTGRVRVLVNQRRPEVTH